MVTSRSNGNRSSDPDLSVRIPKSATPEEAAAIAAVIELHINRDSESVEVVSKWEEKRWRFSGRIESLQGQTVRIPRNAPSDAWRAANRTSLY